MVHLNDSRDASTKLLEPSPVATALAGLLPGVISARGYRTHDSRQADVVLHRDRRVLREGVVEGRRTGRAHPVRALDNWFVAAALSLAGMTSACGTASSAPKTPTGAATDVEAATAHVSPGCDSGVRVGFRDTARFPNIAACAGSWDLPGLEAGATDGHAAALCAEGWHVCTSVAEVKRKSNGLGCSAAALSENGFFAIADGATHPPECFTTGPVGVLGCGSWGAPAPAACAPMDRVSNPGCSALDAPWACGKNNEVWSLAKSEQRGGGVLCCEGAPPPVEATQPSEPWAFGRGTPVQGSGPSECGELTLSTTNTEPWGDDAFRNTPSGAPSVVVVTFSRSITEFHLNVKLTGPKAYITGFNVPPSRVTGRVQFENKEVRLPKGADEGTAVLSWIGVRADALSWVMGGKERATVLSDGYAVECD